MRANSLLNTGNLNISKIYAGLGSYTVGAAESIAAASANSWGTATTNTASAFGVYTASIFNNQASRLATDLGTGLQFSASDLYQVGNSSAGSTTQFVGSLLLFQNGDLVMPGLAGLSEYTPTVIPEPSTCAAILGGAMLGFAAIRRRKPPAGPQV